MWNRISRLAPGLRILVSAADGGDSYAHGDVYSARRKIAPARRTAASTSVSRSTGAGRAARSGRSVNSFGIRVMVRSSCEADTAAMARARVQPNRPQDEVRR